MKRKLILTALFCAILLSLVSCRQAKEITKYDTIYVSKTEYAEHIKYDSIYVHDSVFVTKLGDTVYLYKYKDKYVVQIRHDTITSVDTLYQYKEVVKEDTASSFRKYFRANALAMLISVVIGIAIIAAYEIIKNKIK